MKKNQRELADRPIQSKYSAKKYRRMRVARMLGLNPNTPFPIIEAYRTIEVNDNGNEDC